ncbi:TIGR01620 family protein, partial [Dickeya dianthicola]|nr:TIGR01620 family protein [Dickeya dianthicola]
MNEPLKPRITFDNAPVESAEAPLRPSVAFAEDETQRFVAATTADDDEPDDGESADQVVSDALRPRRSLWRRMLGLGVALFGLSALAQGGRSLYQAWVSQDWIALGGVAAGTLIVCLL